MQKYYKRGGSRGFFIYIVRALGYYLNKNKWRWRTTIKAPGRLPMCDSQCPASRAGAERWGANVSSSCRWRGEGPAGPERAWDSRWRPGQPRSGHREACASAQRRAGHAGRPCAGPVLLWPFPGLPSQRLRSVLTRERTRVLWASVSSRANLTGWARGPSGVQHFVSGRGS